MRILLLTLSTTLWLLLASGMVATAQNKKPSDLITPTDLSNLEQAEAQLKSLFNFNFFPEKVYAPIFALDSVKKADSRYTNRMADSLCKADLKYRTDASKDFVRQLVQALKTTNSYYYPFDSLTHNGLSIIHAPDNTFRIITWALPQFKYSGAYTYEYFGAIQMNSPELKLFGLQDKSSEMGSSEMQVCTPNNWFGALYYGITQNVWADTTYYTLFGWDGHNDRSTKKLADVLYFKDNQPLFGAPIFQVVKDGKMSIKNRFVLEFKEGASVTLNYNAEQQKIIFDSLISEDQENTDRKVGNKKKKSGSGNEFTLVPEGQYCGLEFTEGVWHYLPSVLRSSMTSAPVVAPKLGKGRNGSSIKPPKKKKK